MHNKLKRDRHPLIKLKQDNHQNNHHLLVNKSKINNININNIHPQHPISDEINTNKSNDYYSDQLSNKSGIYLF